MKTILLSAVALLLAAPAFAQTASTSGSAAQSSVYVNSPDNVRSSVRSTPSAIAPGLTSSAVETCMGSASAGGSGMGWGISFGGTYTDKGCEARLDAKIIAQLGDTPSAKERLCDQPKIRAAYARGGRPCAADVARYAASASTARAAPQAGKRRTMKLSEVPRGARYFNPKTGTYHVKG